ncbi:MAG: molybdopterin-guanine dinucleotide biosynthesis protein MobB [Candidatus Eisenbacteria bacterium]|jgi:molybdopterin-guanine dinucleotide biosynthesis protein MobB|nr:molybdopterin-guanine dinucleotide biosynthesis protein MobB [Candidatus Eisenbacteria bacterium]
MNHPPIVSIVGESGTGKTTLIVGLISRLTARGIRCGAIKRGHHLSPDVEGKDTARFAAAGAAPVAGLGPDNAVVHSVILGVPEILGIMTGRVDLVFAEGLRTPEVGWCVVIGDDPRPAPGRVIARLRTVDEDAAIWLAEMLASQFCKVPVTSGPESETRRKAMVELKVNGRVIPLNQFVSNLLEAQMRATVSTLRDMPEKVEEIVLKVVMD